MRVRKQKLSSDVVDSVGVFGLHLDLGLISRMVGSLRIIELVSAGSIQVAFPFKVPACSMDGARKG